MTRRRRAAVLIGLSIILGALAASDVSGREAALRREIGPAVPVLVARRGLAAGARLDAAALAVRRVPSRYAPAGAYRAAAEVIGLRAAVAIPAGADLDPAVVDDGTTPAGPPGPDAPRRRTDRAGGRGRPGGLALAPGARVDVVVTREGAGGSAGSTTLALEDVEVLGGDPRTGERQRARRRPATGRARPARERAPGRLPRGGAELRARGPRPPAGARGPPPRRPGPPGRRGAVRPGAVIGFPSIGSRRRLKSCGARPIAEAAMRLPVARLLLLVCALLAVVPAAANAATPPKVTSVAPLKLKIGERLTIRGKGFLAGKNRNTVLFKATGARAVFVKAESATSTVLVVKVPAKLAPFLKAASGTRFQLRVLAKRLERGVHAGRKARR